MDASPVDHFCATGGADGTVRCFDYVAKTELFRDSWPGASVTALVWAPTSVSKEARAVFAGFSDGVVRVLWRGNAYDESGNPGGWTREQVFKPHNGSVTAMAFSSDGKLFATAGSDGIAFLFQSGQGAPVGAATRSYEPVGFVNVDPSAAGNNGDGNASPRAGYGTMVATSVAFRPDGLALLLTRSDEKVAEVELADLPASAAADPSPSSGTCREPPSRSRGPRRRSPRRAQRRKEEEEEENEAAAAATGDGEGQRRGGGEEGAVMPLPAALAACYFKPHEQAAAGLRGGPGRPAARGGDAGRRGRGEIHEPRRRGAPGVPEGHGGAARGGGPVLRVLEAVPPHGRQRRVGHRAPVGQRGQPARVRVPPAHGARRRPWHRDGRGPLVRQQLRAQRGARRPARGVPPATRL